MYSCKECSKEFRTNWELKRHYGNKRKCSKADTEQQNEAENQLKKTGNPLNEKRESCQKAEKTPNYRIDENIEAAKPILETSVMNGRIYIVRTREFMFNDPSVYKIGRTSQPVAKDGKCKHSNQYPKGSEQVATFAVDDVFAAESLFIRLLMNNKSIKHKTEFGSEYFEGNEYTILSTALEVQQRFRKKQYEDTIDPKRCKFCMKLFTRTSSCKKHIKTCKFQYDEIRLLEIKCHKKTTDIAANECRYCNKTFSRVTHATRHMKTCKFKAEYKLKLQKEQMLL